MIAPAPSRSGQPDPHSGSGSVPRPPMRWNGWGDPDAATILSDAIVGLLRDVLGVSGDARPTLELDDVVVASSRLGADDVARLRGIVGDAHVSTTDADRVLRAGGKSTPDLLRRTADRQDAPDAVVVPGDEGDVAELLAWCAQSDIAVVPFGGGSSVVGGLDPDRGRHRAVISLDLRRFDTLVDLDDVSGIATLGAGVTGPAPRRCSPNADSRSVTSRRVSSSRPSAASRPRGPRVRTRRDTAASTTWWWA